ncbi:putative immunity protein [Anaerosporobacter sp.]|uniref:putative immunity protein n=1 Tax=Anaerosporobacter sp. TaxID=1872529 RepID=UPI00286EBAC2|nr:hypothetical protein [Anaerosporobacter sp.]
MAKLRKMLGSADSPYIVSLMRLIETQSKETIANWCVAYAKNYFLDIYEKNYPEDLRLKESVDSFYAYLAKEITLAELKKIVANVNEAAKEAEDNPVAQAAARAVGQAVASIYTPTHSLGMAFYGAAAIAYDRVGLEESAEIYDQIAQEECAKMEEALKNVAVLDEKKPAKINWNC